MSGHNHTEGTQVNSILRKLEARANRLEQDFGNWYTKTNQTTFATNEPEEALLDSFFAKRIIMKSKTENIGSPSDPYKFRSPKTIVSDGNYSRIVTAITNNYNEELESQDLYTTEELVASVLKNGEYPRNTLLSVPVMTIEEQEQFERINSGIIGKDAYIVIYGFFPEGTESKILIKEKEPKLTEASNQLQVQMYQYEEDTAPTTTREITTKFKNNGIAAVKIKFHPGDDETFDGWKKAISPPKQEGGAVETSIRPQPRPDNLGQQQVNIESENNQSQNDELKIIKNYAELYLDVTVSGQRMFKEEFLKNNSFILSLKKCFCFEMGIANSHCGGAGTSITERHYEDLSSDLGVEKEVFQAVALVESGGRGAFMRKAPQHTWILYERHKAYRFIVQKYGSEKANELSSINSNLVNRRSGGYSGGIAEIKRLNDAKELIDEEIPIMSCSWGKFQVLGEYYESLYESAIEVEEAQNMCELQQFRYFKAFLNKIKGQAIINVMQNKNWARVAELYNGSNYVINSYDTKMEQAYNRLTR